jgi:hypothetical protein
MNIAALQMLPEEESIELGLVDDDLLSGANSYPLSCCNTQCFA